MDKLELKWNDYKMSVDLHRSYLDLVIKLNMFYYAITGAIMSFHFTNGGIEVSKYALLLPLLLSIGFSVFFIWSAKLAHNLRIGIMRRANELQLDVYPEGIVLVLLCIISGTVLALVSIALIFYLTQLQ
jgi:hypothetical protein